MPVLYFVRHGETEFNVQGRLQGRRDTVLNAHGRRQATECGAFLKALFVRDRKRPEQFDYVSSPLKRARETMEVVRATLGLEPLGYAIDDRLVEIAYGDWEGLTLAEIEKQTPASWRSASATNGILRRREVKAIARSRHASELGTRLWCATPLLAPRAAACAPR